MGSNPIPTVTFFYYAYSYFTNIAPKDLYTITNIYMYKEMFIMKAKPSQEYITRQGQRIREMRLTHNFTQAQVAEYLGLDQSNYSKVEHGQRRIRKLSQINKLCLLYNCTHDYIFLKSDEYTPRVWRIH